MGPVQRAAASRLRLDRFECDRQRVLEQLHIGDPRAGKPEILCDLLRHDCSSHSSAWLRVVLLDPAHVPEELPDGAIVALRDLELDDDVAPMPVNS